MFGLRLLNISHADNVVFHQEVCSCSYLVVSNKNSLQCVERSYLPKFYHFFNHPCYDGHKGNNVNNTELSSYKEVNEPAHLDKITHRRA